jgi:tetratricopeptide (TPR) repeat protein
VYYEVGIRHVAQQANCVLISADWSRQLFDVDQMRSLRYPLKETSVTAASAPAIQQVLINGLAAMREAKTPFHALVTTPADSDVFKQQLQELSAFQARLRAVRITGDQAVRQQKVRELIALPPASLAIREIAFELLTLVRDNLSWEDTLAFLDRLPPALRDDPFSREQALLAKAKLGEHELAIAGLQELMGIEGETPERLGLIGGRYKKLWRGQRDGRLQRGEANPGLRELGYLDDAIEHYRRGALLNLNAYYCACNLPLLLSIRATGGDLEEAAFFERLTVLASEIAIERGQHDGWARSSLLGSAIRSGDTAKVQTLALAVAREGPAAWQLESTLADAEDALSLLPADSASRQRLASTLAELRGLLSPG